MLSEAYANQAMIPLASWSSSSLGSWFETKLGIARWMVRLLFLLLGSVISPWAMFRTKGSSNRNEGLALALWLFTLKLGEDAMLVAVVVTRLTDMTYGKKGFFCCFWLLETGFFCV